MERRMASDEKKEPTDLYEAGLRALIEEKGMTPKEALIVATSYKGPGVESQNRGFRNAYNRIKDEDQRSCARQ